MKVTAGDVARWVAEAEPALRGGFVHRVWRADEGAGWVLLVRHHEGGDPEGRPLRRVALAVALAAEWAYVVAVPPEATGADDKRAKKVWARDAHPFLSLLRRHLVGARVEALDAVAGDRVVLLRCSRGAPSAEELARGEGEGPRRLVLAVELIGRAGNLILAHEDDPSAQQPRLLGALNAGRAQRPLEAGGPYRLPPPREGAEAAPPAVLAEVAPDPETLALGVATFAAQRAVAEQALAASRHQELLRAVRRAMQRTEGIQRKLEAELAAAGEADAVERRADLLKAHLGEVPRGAAQVTLTDYSSGEPAAVVLELDPRKTAQEQMKALYKKARKLRSGEVHVRMRQGETDGLAAELRGYEERLLATDPDDEAALEALAEVLVARQVLPRPKPPKQKQQENQGPRSYRTLEGHEVLVGRSDEENDRLTMRIARGNDLFFHVRGCPGSHVILRVDPKRPPNHESLLDAAALAVHYSKARNRGAVDVSYTPRKWVTKPKGAKPGLVRISNEKTVRAGGDPERLARLQATLRREEEG